MCRFYHFSLPSVTENGTSEQELHSSRIMGIGARRRITSVFESEGRRDTLFPRCSAEPQPPSGPKQLLPDMDRRGAKACKRGSEFSFVIIPAKHLQHLQCQTAPP